MAEAHALQPGRLPYKRLPLEFLRPLRRERRGKPDDDGRVSRRVPDGGVVDLQNGLPPEGVIPNRDHPRPCRGGSRTAHAFTRPPESRAVCPAFCGTFGGWPRV